MNSLAKKLSVFFVGILLVFSTILAVTFYKTYEKNYYERYITSLETQAKSISNTLANSELFRGQGKNMQGGRGQGRMPGQSMHPMSGFNSIIKIVDETFLGDVLLVGRDDFANSNNVFDVEKLDVQSRALVEKSFDGKTSSDIFYNTFLEKNTVTVSSPVVEDGNIEYVILLNTNVDTVEMELSSIRNTFIFALIFALVLGMLLMYLLSRRIVAPIKQIEDVTNKIADGKFGELTKIKTKDEIGHLAQNIDYMSRKLEANKLEQDEIEQNKRDFTADVAHELKTPVAVMKASIESIKDGMTNAAAKGEIIDQMYDEINLLERLVNDLLSLSKLENLGFKINKEEVFVNQVINDAIRSQRMIAKKNDVDIVFNDIENPMIQADYSLMKQLLSILINNSIKYTLDKKVLIETQIDRIIVENKGVKISEDSLKNIFNRFYKEGPEGNGLGLAIAKEIANRHGFRIEAISDVETTKFIVYFD